MKATRKIFLLGFLCVVCSSANAASVNCGGGIPEAVKMGELGPNESYILVTIAGQDYRLGLPGDEATKVRTALVLAGFAAGKKIHLRYDLLTDCTTAPSKIPNSVQLVQQ